MWLIVAALVVAVILLAAFVSLHRGEVPVRSERATRTSITSSISTNGKIEPINGFEAHAPAPTTVKQVLVREGEPVKAGQALLQLDDADARKQAAQAQAEIREAESNLAAVQRGGTQEEVLTTQAQLTTAKTDRDTVQRNLDALKELQQKGAASPGEVRDAQARLETAQAQVNLLQQKLTSRYSSPEVARVQAQLDQARAAYAAAEDLLQHSDVRAPRPGTVYFLPVRQGAFVEAGALLVQVGQLQNIQVRAFVDEPDIGRVALGEKVSVTWDAMPGRTWTGTVTQIPTTVVKNGTRTVGELLCAVENQDGKLLPNVNVNVNIVTASNSNALVVPREAVHQEDGHRFVYEIVDGQLQKRVIESSISNLTDMEVTKGLSDNAEVALGSTNGQPLRPGMAVRVVQR